MLKLYHICYDSVKQFKQLQDNNYLLQTKDGGAAYEPYCSMLLCMEGQSLFPSGVKAAPYRERQRNLTENSFFKDAII